MENDLSLVITELAYEDLKGYYSYISENLSNPKAASELLKEFKDAFETIRIFPLSCPLIDNNLIKEEDLRKLIVKKFIVLYLIEDHSVKIVRIIHTSQDYINII